jgi:tetratricopeptide (TPR) repeat protein
MVVAAALGLAQQDDGPILRPKAKPAAKPAAATLLVICDQACNWKLDGKAQGRVAADDPVTVPVSLGQHLVAAVSEDGSDKVEKEVEVKGAGQTLVRFEFAPARAARLKSEQEARNKAQPEGAALLVMCDLACNWKLDGKPQGHIAAGDSATAKVDMGEHLLVAATEDGLDKAQQVAEIKAAGQKIVSIELQPVRAARLKAEQQEAQEKADRETAEKIALEAKNRLLQEAAQMQELRDHAAERSREGWNLFSQQRYTEAKPLLEKACEGGDQKACHNLGVLYENGEGVTQDYAQARAFYQKACDLGEMLGCKGLGYLYQFGRGGPLDYGQSRVLYQKACEGGEMLSCDSLGVLYDNGQGVTQDYAQARTLFQKACDGGDMYGCKNLGTLYQDGRGVPQDYGQARALYKKACDGGYAGACDNLRNLP